VKILVVHNRYREPGGEDEVVRAETAMLSAAGHEVLEYVRTNDQISETGLISRVRLAADTIWSQGTTVTLGEVLTGLRPDVAHIHNTLPLVSPAAYYACRNADVPVVQTLHNYRLICPSATLFRERRVCEECCEGSLLRSIGHGCYRGSRGATAVVATMVAAHRALGTWRKQVNTYIALTEFARTKFVASGLPLSRVLVKPNFVHPDPGARERVGERALFVGRISPEKGVRTMLHAWRRLGGQIPIDVVGDGHERAEMEAHAAGIAGVRFLGRVGRSQAIAAMKDARFLVFPSEWYEGLPMTVIEAFACGVPVIASRLGAMQEIVADRRTGLHFEPGDAADLAAKVDWARTHPAEMAAMGRAARAEFEAKYTAARNYEMLVAIYARALASRKGGAAVAMPHAAPNPDGGSALAGQVPQQRG
jgi:glycosyltransferase involved in cell wall biosynthesis